MVSSTNNWHFGLQEANSCDDEIENLRSDQVELSRHLEEKQLDVQQQQASADILDGDIERRMEEKQKVCGQHHLVLHDSWL